MPLFKTSPPPPPPRLPTSRAVTDEALKSEAALAPAPVLNDLISQMWEGSFEAGIRDMMDWTLSDGYALILRYLYPELQTPAGAAAADLFCSMIADLPVKVTHPAGEERKYLPRWCEEPQPNNLNFCFRDLIMVVARQWFLTGNAYVLIERNPTGGIIGLRPLQTERVRPIGDFANPRYELTRKWSFATHQSHEAPTKPLEPVGTYTGDDILHLARNPWAEEMRGVSQGMLASPTIDAAVYRQNHTTDFFKEGAWKQVLITWKGQEGWIDQDDFKKTLKDVLRSIKARHRAVAVGYDLQPHALGFSASDSQLVEATESARSDIAALGRTPPLLISDNQAGSVSYNSATTSVRIYASYVLEPFCRLLEDRFSRLLDGRWRFNWDIQSLIRGDVVTSSQVDERLERMGAVSINEIREQWGFAPIEGVPAADEPRVNRQYIPLSKLDEVLEKEMSAPEPQPGFGEPNDGNKKGMERDRGDTAEDTERT